MSIAFPGKIHLIFLLWFIKVGVAFRFFLNHLCPENSKTTVTVTREEFLNDISSDGDYNGIRFFLLNQKFRTQKRYQS